jgi:hypothetical protein
MEPISKETWEEIISNQNHSLIGTNIPKQGNGYHDGISWRIPFRVNKNRNEELYNSSFFNVYLRDLSNFINPSYSRKNKFREGLKVNKCSKNYLNTLKKYFGGDNYYSENILHELGEWSRRLIYKGRVIFEIVGWYDNDSNQFYGFQLYLLDNDYCKIGSKNVIFRAPISENDGELEYKKVKIPKGKCIIIEFPKFHGGYNGYKKKIKKVLNLGSQFNFSLDSNTSLTHMKNWDKNINKISSDWGTYNSNLDHTEFYKEYSAFKFIKTAVLCTHEIIGGFRFLINYLNKKLSEEAILEFNIKEYSLDYFEEMERKWMNGNLSFKEANEFLKF